MANHKQHLTFSTVSGLLFGGLAWYPCGFPAVTCLLAGGICSVGGLLPDIDIKTSRSYQDCMSITACIAAMLLIIRVNGAGISPELVSIIGAFAFLAIKFGVGGVIRTFTVHRGMIHSIPFAILCGEIVFLISPGDMSARVLKAIGLTLGCFSHLLLDEIYSVQVTQGKLSTKKSFGTALKFGQFKNMHLTLMMYVPLIIMTYLAFQQPMLVGEAFDKTLDRLAGLTIRGVQHFEVASQKVQQHLRENTNLRGLRTNEFLQNTFDESEQQQLARLEPSQMDTTRGETEQRSSRYAAPPVLAMAENAGSSQVPPFAVSSKAPAFASSLPPVAVTGSQEQSQRPPLLGEISRDGQQYGGSLIASQSSYGSTPPPQVASQPLARPPLLGEIAPSTQQYPSTVQLPPASPIQ